MGNFLTKIYYYIKNSLKVPMIYNKDIEYKIWKNINNPDFIYPENNYQQFNNNNIGICLSGGGLRACCFSYGIMRSLYELDLIKNIKYISGNSGSRKINIFYKKY